MKWCCGKFKKLFGYRRPPDMEKPGRDICRAFGCRRMAPPGFSFIFNGPEKSDSELWKKSPG
jgi:hypothetical protein